MSSLWGGMETKMITMEKAGPANLEAESHVLGAMLTDGEVAVYAQTLVNEHCFYSSNHRAVFKSIAELTKKSISVELPTIVDELKRAGKFDEIGGLPYLCEISNWAPVASVEASCKIVSRDARQRKLVQLLNKNLSELAVVPVENIEELESRLAIIEKESRVGLPEQAKILNYNDLVKHMFETGTEKRGLLTGNPDLDRHVDLRPGQIMVIYGDAAHKKTTLSLNFAVQWAREAKTIFYSTEQRPEALAKIAHDIEGEEPTIKDGNLLFAENTPSIEALIPQVRMLKARSGLDVVFVDYLQDLNTDQLRYYRDETPRISYFIQLLKDLALRESLAVVVISQMRKRTGESDSHSENPSMDRLRGSGDIKMAASIILSIVDPKKAGLSTYDGISTENMLLIRIKKNRDCLTGNPGEERCIKVQNAPGSRKIEPLSEREEEQPEQYWQKD